VKSGKEGGGCVPAQPCLPPSAGQLLVVVGDVQQQAGTVHPRDNVVRIRGALQPVPEAEDHEPVDEWGDGCAGQVHQASGHHQVLQEIQMLIDAAGGGGCLEGDICLACTLCGPVL